MSFLQRLFPPTKVEAPPPPSHYDAFAASKKALDEQIESVQLTEKDEAADAFGSIVSGLRDIGSPRRSKNKAGR